MIVVAFISHCKLFFKHYDIKFHRIGFNLLFGPREKCGVNDLSVENKLNRMHTSRKVSGMASIIIIILQQHIMWD